MPKSDAKPFHESIIESVEKTTSREGAVVLMELTERTIIPDGHERVHAAFAALFKRLGLDNFETTYFLTSLLYGDQTQEATTAKRVA